LLNVLIVDIASGLPDDSVTTAGTIHNDSGVISDGILTLSNS
jgi:hypothetical protein